MNKVLITGGGGFVGQAIVRQLLQQSVSCVVVGRSSYPQLENDGVLCLRGDIRDREFIRSAMEDVDTVFHVAALAGIWGKWNDYYSTNVQGTDNVLTGCLESGVANLVYTSTPSVVFNEQDIEGADESLPYANRFLCHYARSKMMAEKMVLQVDQAKLRTCAIRPHLIWGPGDPHLIPRLLERGKAGDLKMVGAGANRVDISFVDNVAHAHLLAAKALKEAETCCGKPYFISQGEPVNLWQWINDLFDQLNINQVSKSVSLPLAYRLGAFLEFVYTVLQSRNEPPMTRFLAEQLGRSHFFSISAARRDMGYEPVVSTDEGMEKLIKWIHSI